MFPDISAFDVGNVLFCDFILFCQIHKPRTVRKCFLYLNNVLGGKFCVWFIGASQNFVSSFREHVLRIFERSACKEMGRVRTPSIIAPMANEQTRWNFSYETFEREPVRGYVLPSVFDITIPMTIGARPFPAQNFWMVCESSEDSASRRAVHRSGTVRREGVTTIGAFFGTFFLHVWVYTLLEP